MLDIKNIEKISGYKYNAAFFIKKVEVDNEFYTFLFYNRVVGEMHPYPIKVLRTPNEDGCYKVTYKGKAIMADKVCFTSMEKLIEVFKKF